MPVLPAGISSQDGGTRAEINTAIGGQPMTKRQTTVAIPALYQNQTTSPSPGAVVGIVLGSVAAFLLLIWLFSTLTGMNLAPLVQEEVVVARRSRSPRSRRSRRSEMTNRSPRQERIIRQERIVRDSSRAAPRRESYVVTEETREPLGGDTVEVVEEGSSVVTDIRRDHSRRRSRSRY